MKRRLALFVLVLLLAALSAPGAGPAAAQERPRDPVATVPDSGGAEVLVLGTFHFFREEEMVMSPERQREIREVVDALARFRPNRVILEEQVADSARLDSLYAAYRAGRHELTANERQQLGFRLADRMDLDRVWSVDYQYPWPMDKVRSFAQRYDTAFVSYMERWREEMEAAEADLYREGTIADALRYLNSPDFLSRLQAFRVRTMEVDAGGTYVGLAPQVSIWKRNMRIFANIARVVEPGDRAVVIYGAGHGYFFRKWVLQHPEMELVEPADYLPGSSPRDVALAPPQG